MTEIRIKDRDAEATFKQKGAVGAQILEAAFGRQPTKGEASDLLMALKEGGEARNEAILKVVHGLQTRNF